MAKVWLILMVAGLSGCGVGDGTVIERPANAPHSAREAYAMAAAESVLDGPYASAPNRVRAAYADCSAAYLIENMTPEERADAEAFAAGQKKMTVGEWKTQDAAITQRAGGPITYATIERLSGTCPNDVPDFKKYFGPGFNGL